MVNKSELRQAESLIHEIENSSSHPAVNKRHPSHRQVNQAYRMLKSKVAQARAELALQERYNFEKL